MRRLVVAGAILAIASLGPLLGRPSPVTAIAPSDSQRATAALDYLLAQQSSNGSLDGSLGETADFVIGAAAAGLDPATLAGCAAGTSALDFIATASDVGASDPARTGKGILAVVAAGGDPSSFAGRNLLARLSALYDSTSGAYGGGSTFGQAFAILGLVAAGQAVPAKAITELGGLQDPDGSWSYGSAPVAAGEGDSNSTAIALMALDQAGDHSADTAALAYLATQQMSDGGFAYQNPSPWGPAASDPDSDAVVLQALVAAGENPTGSTWTVGSNTVITNLRSTQGADGGYAYPGGGESAFTTSEVPAALVRYAYAATAHFTPGASLPGSRCAAASPSSSADASASASTSPGMSPSQSPAATPTKAPTPRPTVRVTARPTAVPTPAPTPTESPSPSSGAAGPESATEAATAQPTGLRTSTVVPTASPSAVSAVAGRTSTSGSGSGADASNDGGPVAWLWYLLAAVAALLVVAGAGWFLTTRPAKR